MGRDAVRARKDPRAKHSLAEAISRFFVVGMVLPAFHFTAG